MIDEPRSYTWKERIEALVYRTKAMAATALAALGGATVQRGTAALTNGVSPAIPATITATSRIFVDAGTSVADALTVSYAALDADRVIGAPGSFVIRAFTAAGREVANTNAADQSTSINWLVIN